MDTKYALVGLLAAVPIAVIIVVLLFRGYDFDMHLHRPDEQEREGRRLLRRKKKPTVTDDDAPERKDDQ